MFLKPSDVEVEVLCEPEEIPIEGNASATGDAAQDEETNRWVRSELARGNEWAWCTVQVRVHYMERLFMGTSTFLGCCSYRSEADFRQPGGYFDDLLQEALADLEAQLLTH